MSFLGASPEIRGLVEFSGVSSLKPFTDVAIMVLAEVFRHQVVNFEF